MVADLTEVFETNQTTTNRYHTRSQKGEKTTSMYKNQCAETGKKVIIKMNGSKTAQEKLPIMQRNRISGGIPGTKIPMKG